LKLHKRLLLDDLFPQPVESSLQAHTVLKNLLITSQLIHAKVSEALPLLWDFQLNLLDLCIFITPVRATSFALHIFLFSRDNINNSVNPLKPKLA
jgi:hypothetical protein